MSSLTIEQYQAMESAWEYQDLVSCELFKLGISVNALQSRKYQMEYGESLSGIEIKNDRQMARTGNIYIEFKQTTMRGSTEKESGIKQKDKSWLYVIGNEEVIYVLAKNQLVSLLSKVEKNQEKWKVKGLRLTNHKNEKGEITSYGLVIPVKYVEENNLMMNKIIVEKENKNEI